MQKQMEEKSKLILIWATQRSCQPSIDSLPDTASRTKVFPTTPYLPKGSGNIDTDSCHATRIPAGNSSTVASLAVTSIATLTTNYVRWMFLVVPSAHAVGYQEEIPPGEH